MSDQDREPEGQEPSLRELARRFIRTSTEVVMGQDDEEEEPEAPEPARAADRPEAERERRRGFKKVASLAGKGQRELARLIIKEARSYLEMLDLDEILTRYSLEVRASIRLKDVSGEAGAPPKRDPEA